MSSLEHSKRNDTDPDEELPSLEFIQNVQDHCQNVSEQTISEESLDSTAGSSSMTCTPALNVERPETETVESETSRVPENLIAPEEVSPPVAATEEVPCNQLEVPDIRGHADHLQFLHIMHQVTQCTMLK